MAAVWREAEDSHAILLAVVYCLHEQRRFTVVYQITTELSLEGLACATKCFTYRTKWYYFVIYADGWTVYSVTVLVRCFYLTAPYPIALSCQNTKINPKIIRRLPVDLPI
jgi:hypothetical protein